MTREIKFRAWYVPEKLMCDWAFILSNLSVYDKPFDETEDWKVMQYTGLKDKNGVEIYEGDVVENYSKERGVVKWDRESWAVEDIGLADGVVSSLRYLSNFAFSPNDGDNLWCEIIGNIYSNSELLQ